MYLCTNESLCLHLPFPSSKVKIAQSCPTLCNPMDYTVRGILQARILEWVVFPFSRGSSQPRIKLRSLALQADSFPAEPRGKPQGKLSSGMQLITLLLEAGSAISLGSVEPMGPGLRVSDVPSMAQSLMGGGRPIQ